jgi:hypothetical protein
VYVTQRADVAVGHSVEGHSSQSSMKLALTGESSQLMKPRPSARRTGR